MDPATRVINQSALAILDLRSQQLKQENNISTSQSYDEEKLIESELPRILKLADIGYSISLITLVLALFILTCVRRLRSPRNHLHLQLFISFIIRCTLHLIRRHVLQKNDYDLNVSQYLRIN